MINLDDLGVPQELVGLRHGKKTKIAYKWMMKRGSPILGIPPYS